MLIGIELGDARVTAVAVDDAGCVRGRARVDVVNGIDGAAASALYELAAAGEPGAIGLASPTPDADTVQKAAIAIRARLPVSNPTILPSGAAAALAEHWIGAGKGTRDLVLFAVGDHATAGLVRGGEPVLGAHGRAASVAWLALNPVEREDYRKIGCLETEVAANGIVRRLIWRIKAGDRSCVQEMVDNDLSAITMTHVLKAARDGDGVSVSVMRDTAKYLGMAGANLAALADPEMLVLGGTIASAADLLLEPVRVELSRRLPRSMADALTVVPATLGDDAASIGAARLARNASARP